MYSCCCQCQTDTAIHKQESQHGSWKANSCASYRVVTYQSHHKHTHWDLTPIALLRTYWLPGEDLCERVRNRQGEARCALQRHQSAYGRPARQGPLTSATPIVTRFCHPASALYRSSNVMALQHADRYRCHWRNSSSDDHQQMSQAKPTNSDMIRSMLCDQHSYSQKGTA